MKHNILYKQNLTVDIVDLEEELDLVVRRLARELVHRVQELLHYHWVYRYIGYWINMILPSN